MARPKSVTIKLTAKQRQELQRLTGAGHNEVLFERVTGRGGKVAARASLAKKSPLSLKAGGAGLPGQEYSGDFGPK